MNPFYMHSKIRGKLENTLFNLMKWLRTRTKGNVDCNPTPFKGLSMFT